MNFEAMSAKELKQQKEVNLKKLEECTGRDYNPDVICGVNKVIKLIDRLLDPSHDQDQS